jgi:hypothetical protein
MAELKKFLEESPMASRVTLPTRIILRRFDLGPEEVGSIVESGRLKSGDAGRTCELEIGGQRVAGGRIVKRRGEFFFKVREMGEGKEL